MRILLGLALALTIAQTVPAPRSTEIRLDHPLNANDPNLPRAMAEIAWRVLVLDAEPHPRTKLENRLYMKLAARHYNQAAKAATRRTLASMSSRDAHALEYSFDTPLTVLQTRFKSTLKHVSGTSVLGLNDALAVVRSYELLAAYREFQTVADEVSAADDSHRYVVNENVQVSTQDGATLCALIIRPRVSVKLTALLNFRSTMIRESGETMPDVLRRTVIRQ